MTSCFAWHTTLDQTVWSIQIRTAVTKLENDTVHGLFLKVNETFADKILELLLRSGIHKNISFYVA
jgi:hypothetical protein